MGCYLDRLRSIVADITVVDGSPQPIRRAHEVAWSRYARLVPPDEGSPTAAPQLNGKVVGSLTGIRAARHEVVVLADDDVRHTRESITAIAAALEDADLVRPVNVFDAWPWQARWDGARTLLNVALATDWPGTFGFRPIHGPWLRRLECGRPLREPGALENGGGGRWTNRRSGRCRRSTATTERRPVLVPAGPPCLRRPRPARTPDAGARHPAAHRPRGTAGCAARGSAVGRGGDPGCARTISTGTRPGAVDRAVLGPSVGRGAGSLRLAGAGQHARRRGVIPRTSSPDRGPLHSRAATAHRQPVSGADRSTTSTDGTQGPVCRLHGLLCGGYRGHQQRPVKQAAGRTPMARPRGLRRGCIDACPHGQACRHPGHT